MSIAEKLTQLKTDFDEVKAAGINQGKADEHHNLWHNYQQYGDKNQKAERLFAGNGWRDWIFRPIYDIPIGNATFYNSSLSNLKQCLIDSGVSFWIAEPLSYTFHWSHISHVPDLSGTELTNDLNNTFSYCLHLHTIDGIRVTENVKFTNTFDGSTLLENITFYGTIGQSVNFSDNPLSVESMKSIISCLKDCHDTVDAGKNAITFNEECWDALEADSAPPDGETWKEYIATCLGWNAV